MKAQTLSAESQRREVNYRLQSSASARHRSLKQAPGRQSFAPLRLCVKVMLILLLIICAGCTIPLPVMGQEVADTIRINTRVVFLEAMVKDKRTGVPIADLHPENFEVLDDGQPRTISYFTREGDARKPLALVLVLDLREDGAGRFLKRPEILEVMAAELAKLSPGDEVAIIAVNYGEDDNRILLTNFTGDRARIAAALQKVPKLIGPDNEISHDVISANQGEKLSTANVDDTKKEQSAFDALGPPPPPPVGSLDDLTMQNVETVERYTDRKTGATITRTIMKDGTTTTNRVSKSGKVTLELDNEYSLYAATREVSEVATKLRPNSRAAIVWVTDGLIPIVLEDRTATEDLLLRSGVTFNSLTVSMRTLYRVLLPFVKPVGNWIGMSFSGSAKYLAKSSGGEAVNANRASDYARGLSKIIGNLTARYSLGFALAQEEKDDGRLHNLEVRVKATDAKGKKRKLEVNARRGYYMSAAQVQSTPANTAKSVN